MRVILDTNVLVGALISTQGPPHQIYKYWRNGRFALITSEVQLEELKRVSHYPKLRPILPPHRIGTIVNQLRTGEVLDALPNLPASMQIKDPDACRVL